MTASGSMLADALADRLCCRTCSSCRTCCCGAARCGLIGASSCSGPVPLGVRCLPAPSTRAQGRLSLSSFLPFLKRAATSGGPGGGGFPGGPSGQNGALHPEGKLVLKASITTMQACGALQVSASGSSGFPASSPKPLQGCACCPQAWITSAPAPGLPMASCCTAKPNHICFLVIENTCRTWFRCRTSWPAPSTA